MGRKSPACGTDEHRIGKGYVTDNVGDFLFFLALVDVSKEDNGYHSPPVWTVRVLGVRPNSVSICQQTIDANAMAADAVECLRDWCHDWLVDAGVDFVIEELIQGAGL